MEAARKNDLIGMAAALTGCTIFGFTFVLTKHILNAGLSPYALLTWRLAIASLLLGALALAGVFKMNLAGKKPLRLLPVALCEPCVYFVCESYGIARTTASESGTIIALIPICVLILTRLIFKERHTKGQIAGVLLSVVGVIAVVVAKNFAASLSVSGYCWLAGAVLLAAFYNIGVRRMSNDFTSAEMTFITNLIGLGFFVVLTCAEGLIKGNFAAMWLLPLQQPRILIYILLLAAGASVGAFMLVIYAIGRIGPTRSSTFACISTVNSIIFGMILLGERMLPGQLIGAAMIIVGVWCANYFVRLEPLPQAGTAPAGADEG